MLIPKIVETAMLAGAAAEIVIAVVDDYGEKLDLSAADVSVGISTNSTTTPYEYLTITQVDNVITIPLSSTLSSANSGQKRFISCWVTSDSGPAPVARICIEFVKSTRG